MVPVRGGVGGFSFLSSNSSSSTCSRPEKAGFVFTGQDLIRDGGRPKNRKPRREPFLLETSVPAIFGAGDVRHGVIRRVASAVGQGVVAVSLVHKYLETV